LTLFHILSLHFPLTSAKPCYSLDGSIANSEYGACNPSAEHSGYCAIHQAPGSVDVRLDNGLCMATGDIYFGTIWSDGCTDPTCLNSGCPKLCPGPHNNFSNLNPVTSWSIKFCDYGQYCCRAFDDHRDCCTNSSSPKITTNLIGTFKFQISTEDGEAAISTPGVGSGASTTGSNTASTAMAPPSSQKTMTTTPTPTLAPVACPENKSTIVGGAVGGALGAVILGLVATLLWMLRRNPKQSQYPHIQADATSSQHWNGVHWIPGTYEADNERPVAEVAGSVPKTRLSEGDYS
ncbi:hypothetical protein GQ43DRAFT_376015, partial [Delitschia confertaspora ATCC 74209]